MPSDLHIARSVTPRPILDVAAEWGLRHDEIEPHGWHKAKVRLEALHRLGGKRPAGKYVVVTAITPTPLGEGKTVTTIGLAQALNKIGKRAIVCIRQPSMGPVFGIKGGAAGGGYSQVIPMEDFNLHLTGDIHAVAAAHNLLAAAVDTSLLLKNPLDIDPLAITLRRVVDMNDRALRHIVIGLGGKENGVPRETGFDIAVASEVMAVLALAENLGDLRQRLGRMIFGYDRAGRPLTADRLGAAGAMAALLRDAIKPTLMQTLEGTPAFVHCGPFANIAHGNSSLVADRLALQLGDYVVTEAGFGADMGFEKFVDIKCRASGLRPDAVVVVASVRALKMHSGRFQIVAGKPLPAGLGDENLEALAAGLANLEAHLRNIRQTGVPAVVAINRFDSDTPAELALVRERALAAGAAGAAISELWARGGDGGRVLAEAVAAAAETPSDFRFYYEVDQPLRAKIERLCTGVYGAAGVSYAPAAKASLERLEGLGCGHLPVCMAKTHLSISHDPTRKGAPTGYTFPVTDARVSAGAGFVYVLAGDMKTMPGLGSNPAYRQIDLDEDGAIQGLF
ncbi:MAG: formate--tetrahydrofolate ligase [Lentisphaeria bacterium]